jgi:hypothetical protein
LSEHGNAGLYRTEIDILGVNGEYAVPFEIKSTPGPDDVKEFIGKQGKFFCRKKSVVPN